MFSLFKKKKQGPLFDRRDALVLGAGLSAYVALALATITKFSVWFDEAFGAYLIRFDFWQVGVYTAADVHPPLYYWILKLWGMAFGTDEFALRSLSILFGAIAITFGYLLVRRLFTRKAAIFALVFMILTPIFIRYSQEMRMYTLVAAIVMAATYTLVVAMQTGKRKAWILYGILVALGMWTHYFTALLWLAHVAWHAYDVWRPKIRLKEYCKKLFAKEWVGAYGLAILLYLPWLPALITQLTIIQGNGFWIPPVTPMTVPNFFTNMLFYKDVGDAQSWLAVLLFVILVSLIVLVVRLLPTLKAEQKRFYLLIMSMAITPIVLLVLASMPPLRPAFIDRYLITSALVLSMFIGVTLALSKLKRTGRSLLAMLIVLAMLIGLGSVATLGNYNKNAQVSNNARQVVDFIRAEGKPGQPIIADSPWLFYEAVFYNSSAHTVYFIDAQTEYIYGSLEMLKQNDQFKIKDLQAFTDEHPTVWYMGKPEDGKLKAPDPSWQSVRQFTFDDPVTRKPLYMAVEYTTR